MAELDALYPRGTVRLTPGRIEWCARAIAKRLDAREEATLVPLAREAEAVAHRAYDLFATREKAKTAYFSDVARGKDQELDDASSGVYQILDLHARIHAAGTEMGDRVRRLTALFFPLNLKAVTSASFAEEIAATRRIVERARDRAAEVAKVPGLVEVLEVLDARSKEFEAVLEREKPSGPSYADAATAGDEAERRLAELVLGILFVHRGDAPEAARRRAELLEPYVIQQESLRDRYRRRLTPAEVDPETGEELGDATSSAEPAQEPEPVA